MSKISFRGPIVPCEDWVTVLTKPSGWTALERKSSCLKPITWVQIAPALPPAGLTSQECEPLAWREGPSQARTSGRLLTNVLLPPRAFAPTSDAGQSRGCFTMTNRQTFVPQDVFLMRWQRQCSMGFFEAPKKGKLVEGTNLPMFEADLKRDSFQCVPADN